MTRLDQTLMPLLLAGSMLASACVDDPGDPGDPMAADEGTTTNDAPGSTGEPPDEPETAGASSDGADSSGGLDLDAIYGCEEPDFQVIQPLSGPGIDPETGALLEPLQDSYVLHTTQILVGPEQFEAFLALNVPIIEQLAETDGLIGFALASEPNCGFSRTMGVWRDEQSLYAFVSSGAHLQAMAQTLDVSITGRTTSWTASVDQMPLSWEMALAAIDDVEPSAVYD